MCDKYVGWQSRKTNKKNCSQGRTLSGRNENTLCSVPLSLRSRDNLRGFDALIAPHPRTTHASRQAFATSFRFDFGSLNFNRNYGVLVNWLQNGTLSGRLSSYVYLWEIPSILSLNANDIQVPDVSFYVTSEYGGWAIVTATTKSVEIDWYCLFLQIPRMCQRSCSR